MVCVFQRCVDLSSELTFTQKVQSCFMDVLFGCMSIFSRVSPLNERANDWFLLDSVVLSTDQYHCRVLGNRAVLGNR